MKYPSHVKLHAVFHKGQFFALFVFIVHQWYLQYLGLWVQNDLSWEDHILELCRKMNYYVHMFRRLRKILPSQLLLSIYKYYVQSKIDYGVSKGVVLQNLTSYVQRIQNLLARIVCNNFEYINFRGIEMVWTLRLQTICERRDYFLCILMFKCIHGLAPHYSCNDVTMYVDINGYDTRSADNMDLYLPRCSKEINKGNFLYMCVYTCYFLYVYFILQQGTTEEQPDWMVHPV